MSSKLIIITREHEKPATITLSLPLTEEIKKEVYDQLIAFGEAPSIKQYIDYEIIPVKVKLFLKTKLTK